MSDHSCSTILFSHNDDCFIGHNLDDYIEVPGLVVVNRRSIAKHNLSWDALRLGLFVKEPKIEWISRYGSVTYNPMGREMPDGGVNEAGLYVGEMTMFGTTYPADPDKPKFYHQHWIQYLLDNFATVYEVLASLDEVQISGHCQWHFFIADKSGESAILEFNAGKPVIYSGVNMPYPLLCNRPYERDISLMREYQPFGGEKPLTFGNCDEDPRFAWAVAMLEKFPQSGKTALDYTFAILKQMDCGNNRFSVVYDLKNLRIYFHTYRHREIRYADFNAFDFSGDAPSMILNIHQPLSGDVAANFMPYTEMQNAATLREFVGNVNWGNWVLNKLWTRIFTNNILTGIRSF